MPDGKFKIFSLKVTSKTKYVKYFNFSDFHFYV